MSYILKFNLLKKFTIYIFILDDKVESCSTQVEKAAKKAYVDFFNIFMFFKFFIVEIEKTDFSESESDNDEPDNKIRRFTQTTNNELLPLKICGKLVRQYKDVKDEIKEEVDGMDETQGIFYCFNKIHYKQLLLIFYK